MATRQGGEITALGIISPRGDYGIFFNQDGSLEVVKSPSGTQEVVIKITAAGDMTLGAAATDLIGFFGAAPVARQAALTAEPAAAPAGGVGAAAGAWDTAANRDAAITTINDTRTRVGEIETKLQALGLLA